MFTIDEFTTATLSSVNPRAEIHGPDKVPAADLKFSIKTHNGVLSEFGSQLRSSFYWNSGEPAQQGELVAPLTDLPNLRNPMIEGIAIKTELVGYTLTIDHGLGGKSNLVLTECDVNAIKLDMQEGGTVILGFRVQAHPDEKSMGKLCSAIGSEVSIMLTAPEAETELA